jgi:site-specific DNA-methyltransferase (adenine-specific)
VIHGDARDILPAVPEQLFDVIVTSPPYFCQRDYGEPGQLGQEESPEAYVSQLVQTARLLRRVLRPTGSLWLVLGDKYQRGMQLGMPWRVALGLQADGWILRSDVIWHKPNAMPSPVKNRPTVDHEYVFFFSRAHDYYYNADAIREPHVTFTAASKMRGGRAHLFKRHGTPEQGKFGGQSNLHRGRWDQAFHPLGRNKRTVWSIPLSKNRDAHFAVFPEQLVATCIRASSPEGGWVLDPFLGSGTTAVVARRLGRAFVGIDCQAEYCRLAERRLQELDRPHSARPI